ncbi:MAG: efflux RND transporter periplasmic adaptor subunit [Rubrivivax sp.]|nr:MAG: efflux RND transporter periplasmic adaptor subunit [Rubrivivax sp.]
MSPELSAPRPALRRARILGLAVLMLLLGGAGVRAYVSHSQARALKTVTAHNALRSVLTTRPEAGGPQRSLTLPATLRGASEAAVHARTNGYLQRWTTDIGERIGQGELLAVIDTPEVDQDLAQARASREQIKARLGLASSSLDRWEGLRLRDAVPQQELDERRAAHQQAMADLAAAEASVRRLEQLQAFGRITAPFDGVVVRRQAEVGELVAAGSGASNKELFYIARMDRLKLTVGVPQSHAADIRTGQPVSVRLLERPGVAIQGTVARTSGAIDGAARSMQVEVELPNPDRGLLPGAYVEVSIPLASGVARRLTLPPTALQFRQDGPRVAVVRADQTITLRNVKLGRDFGRRVEVLSGLEPTDVVVLNPHDAVEEGQKVLAREAPPDKAPARQAAAARAA